MLLRDTDAVATLAVKDLGAAARFYEDTLGLSRAGTEDDEAIVFESGDTTCTGPVSPARTKPRR
jgi:catechol 2,3-dioxygenase-like lactoylglutathione lyase family enzyme